MCCNFKTVLTLRCWMCCSTGTLLTVIMTCEYCKMVFSHKHYLCRKMNFTTSLWISVFLVLRGKYHENFFGTFVLYSEYSTCWHWQRMCGGQVIYFTLSLVLFLACLQRILSAHSLKMEVTLAFLNYLTVIENKIIHVFGRILLQLLEVLGFYLSSLHSEDL